MIVCGKRIPLIKLVYLYVSIPDSSENEVISSHHSLHISKLHPGINFFSVPYILHLLSQQQFDGGWLSDILNFLRLRRLFVLASDPDSDLNHSAIRY